MEIIIMILFMNEWKNILKNNTYSKKHEEIQIFKYNYKVTFINMNYYFFNYINTL